MRPATCCWWRWLIACAERCAPATWWRGSAVTNSSSSWRKPESAAISSALQASCCRPSVSRCSLAATSVTPRRRSVSRPTADGIDAQTLTKNADMAMYLAKEDGKNGFRFFSRDIKVQSIERLTLETALRRALERDQFSLHYQPKVDMLTGQITGVEALLRWVHPDFGVVSPMQFIPLAEEIGLIVPIGRWVLKEACAQNMAWQRRGLRPVSMAVNLSPRQFADPNLLHDVDEALVASAMSAVLLQLEVTESMVMRNVSRAIRVLDAIQSRGIRIAIDDFGTGHSSMSLMKQFPIDTIKIDRSFVRDLAEDPEDQAIAQAIISMGKALGMTVVAEG